MSVIKVNPYDREFFVRTVLTLSLIFSMFLSPSYSVAKETRCGWFYNPTPGNAWLIDRHGWWGIGTQGGFQATGIWPILPEQVNTNRNYGYGCACMVVTTNKSSGRSRIVRIHSAKGLPLRNCRTDKTLPSEYNWQHSDY
jgi:hypothetical protein